MSGRGYKEYYIWYQLWTFKETRKTPVSTFHLHSELTGNLLPFVPSVILPYVLPLMSNIFSRVNIRGRREIFLTGEYISCFSLNLKCQLFFFLVKMKKNPLFPMYRLHTYYKVSWGWNYTIKGWDLCIYGNIHRCILPSQRKHTNLWELFLYLKAPCMEYRQDALLPCSAVTEHYHCKEWTTSFAVSLQKTSGLRLVRPALCELVLIHMQHLFTLFSCKVL